MVTVVSGIKVCVKTFLVLYMTIYNVVTFRLVVFRPFVSEIIVGTVKDCTEEYVRGVEWCFVLLQPANLISIIEVTTGFFDDIIVPQAQLPFPNAL